MGNRSQDKPQDDNCPYFYTERENCQQKNIYQLKRSRWSELVFLTLKLIIRQMKRRVQYGRRRNHPKEIINADKKRKILDAEWAYLVSSTYHVEKWKASSSIHWSIVEAETSKFLKTKKVRGYDFWQKQSKYHFIILWNYLSSYYQIIVVILI